MTVRAELVATTLQQDATVLGVAGGQSLAPRIIGKLGNGDLFQNEGEQTLLEMLFSSEDVLTASGDPASGFASVAAARKRELRGVF